MGEEEEILKKILEEVEKEEKPTPVEPAKTVGPTEPTEPTELIEPVVEESVAKELEEVAPTPPTEPTSPAMPAEKPVEEVVTVPETEVTPKVEEEVVKVKEAEEKPVELPPIEEEVSPPAKSVWLIFGDKGTGKTLQAFSFPGKIVCLSFDRKATFIKANFYNNDDRIHIFDIIKHIDYSDPKKMVESANIAYNLILAILDYAEKHVKPDWVVVDGSELFQQICEWRMRYKHDLGPFDGIANLNLWKERRMYIRQVHYKALDVAKRGVIYTTYSTKDEIVVAGTVHTRKDVPKWIDVIMFETDYVLKTELDPTTRRFTLTIVTSKVDKVLPTGKVYDVTDRKLWEVVKTRP